ncbi:hypothetical protein C7N83_04920 [Neisseria iguanae]|uniref:Uncharacterized protein n=2 Tax=Neisseria iguanae TaxID=90242 RepID=A0A2P7U0Z1_9NEIS|nr:hypothetical protein C7N83_04920 [Neisseria iguanae]
MTDIKYCLGADAEDIPDKHGNIYEPIRNKYNRTIIGHEKIKSYSECMREEKGYIYREISW